MSACDLQVENRQVLLALLTTTVVCITPWPRSFRWRITRLVHGSSISHGIMIRLIRSSTRHVFHSIGGMHSLRLNTGDHCNCHASAQEDSLGQNFSVYRGGQFISLMKNAQHLCVILRASSNVGGVGPACMTSHHKYKHTV